ncbi:MAG: rod shape-determining protein RodA [Phormidesmis priestleyi]|uniref:Rod shape-determining protein RodA n=1 Tax=Phormidesmis priestleyi TaxID=268141 RepID=A0A2W4XH93_9CYAN|nr:MAG: rod shape-determining protein RodA [Phormidesmis priestleyi]
MNFGLTTAWQWIWKCAKPWIAVFAAIWISLGFNALPASAAITLLPAPETARVYIISPADQQTVPETFAVKFGLVGMGIAPAGIDKAGTGHHHLLIDVDELPDLKEPLAATANIKHFGGGQTETTLSLPPGEHTLQLLLGNYTHVPHDHPVLSEKIAITVQ